MGFVSAFGALLVFLFHPTPIRIASFALEFPIAFALGIALSAWVPPLRRALVSRQRLARNATRAAGAAFVELGVGNTRARTGILVLVAMFERRVVVVSDTGVDRGKLTEEVGNLEAALDRTPDLTRCIAALDAVGEPLARRLPVAADDTNELLDTVSVA